MARLLRPGGRLLVTLPLDCRDSLFVNEDSPAPFRILERCYGVREEDMWSLTSDDVRASRAEGDAVCLVALEQAETNHTHEDV
jgi:hypothetical protein